MSNALDTSWYQYFAYFLVCNPNPNPSFEDTVIWIFSIFGLKCLLLSDGLTAERCHTDDMPAPKIHVFAVFDVLVIIKTPKKHFLMPSTHRRCWRDTIVQLSCVGVGGVNTEHSSQLAHGDCRLVRSHCRHDNSTCCWQICSDLLKLSPTSCEFCTHRRRDSTWQRSPAP